MSCLWSISQNPHAKSSRNINNDCISLFSESVQAQSTMWRCCCVISASAAAFARPSLLFHADNCPHLNHRPTIGSNWHVASAVLGEIWECTRPRTGCPFHQLESCLLVGRGLGEVYLAATSSLDQNDLWRSSSSLHSSLPPCLPLSLSCHWGITVCELLVRVFSQGPQPATDSLTVVVSGTFTWEVLWQAGCARQASQWKCSTQLFAAGFLIHYLLALFSTWTYFSFSTSGCDAELSLTEAEVSLNSWTWASCFFSHTFDLLLVYWLFVVLSPGMSSVLYSCMALLWRRWRNDGKCLMWLEMSRPHKVPWDPSAKDHRPQCMLLTLLSWCHREGCGTNTQPPYSLPSRSLLSSKPPPLRISLQ